MSPIFWTFSFCFVPVICAPIRIHCYSCSIVLDTDRPVLSLKLPLLHLFRSFHGKDAPIFLDFFVLFRSSDLYTHQNPSLLLFHSAGHRQACIIIETPFVTLVPMVPREKMSPNFLDFFVLFRSSDFYTHQNPSLLLFHSSGHRHACIIIETPFVTFVSSVTWKRCPKFFQRQVF